MVDIARDAHWGRIVEGAGEDPYLGAAFARAYVRGYQGERLSDSTSIVACAKHFVGYGAAEAGAITTRRRFPSARCARSISPRFTPPSMRAR